MHIKEYKFYLIFIFEQATDANLDPLANVTGEGTVWKEKKVFFKFTDYIQIGYIFPEIFWRNRI